MAITVREALSIGPLTRSSVVAGAAGLDRLIETITVLEAPDSFEWIKGKELALTIGYMYKDDPQLLASLVEELDRREAAALGIKFERYLRELPPAAKEKADQLGLPILTIPYDCCWIDIFNPLYNYLLDEETKRRYHAQQVNAHFINILLKNQGLAALLSSLSQMIHCPVAVFNTHRKRLAYALPPGTHESEMGSEVQPVMFPITLPKARIGYLGIYNKEPLTPLDTITINQALMAISLQFVKEQAIREVERRYENQFITDLLNGNFESKEVVLKRAQAFGWDFSRGHVSVVLEIDQLNDYFMQYGNAEEYRTRRDQLLELIRQELPRQLQQAVVTEYGNHALIIALEGEEVQSSSMVVQVTEAVRGLVAEAAQILSPLTASAGMSGYYREITDLHSSYAEAKQALTFGRMFRGPGSITCFEDLGVYRLLCNLPREQLVDFVEQHLGPLLHFNSRQKTTFLETLRCYLLHGGNSSEAARALYVHRRTLRYRLNKIQKILKVDLSNPITKLNLSIAYMAQTLLGNKEV